MDRECLVTLVCTCILLYAMFIVDLFYVYVYCSYVVIYQVMQ